MEVRHNEELSGGGGGGGVGGVGGGGRGEIPCRVCPVPVTIVSRPHSVRAKACFHSSSFIHTWQLTTNLAGHETQKPWGPLTTKYTEAWLNHRSQSVEGHPHQNFPSEVDSGMCQCGKIRS